MSKFIILAIIGSAIAIAATITQAILEKRRGKSHEWLTSLSILGVGLGIIAVMLWTNSNALIYLDC